MPGAMKGHQWRHIRIKIRPHLLIHTQVQNGSTTGLDFASSYVCTDLHTLIQIYHSVNSTPIIQINPEFLSPIISWNKIAVELCTASSICQFMSIKPNGFPALNFLWQGRWKVAPKINILLPRILSLMRHVRLVEAAKSISTPSYSCIEVQLLNIAVDSVWNAAQCFRAAAVKSRLLKFSPLVIIC